MSNTRQEARMRRKRRIRKKMAGTAQRPRLVVYRSLRHISVQVVDDEQHRVLVTASSQGKAAEAELGKVPKKERAKKVGTWIAARCKDKGIAQVVFDRNGYQYHGRVQALADAAREGGLSF